MVSGGPKPPRLTRYSSEDYTTKVLKKDPNWLRDSQENVEYEMSSNGPQPRTFKGFYRSRGPYAPV